MSQRTSVTLNFGWMGLLGIIFVLCKVFEVAPIAAWSWWLVLAPFWVPFGMFVLIFAVLFVLAIATALLT